MNLSYIQVNIHDCHIFVKPVVHKNYCYWLWLLFEDIVYPKTYSLFCLPVDIWDAEQTEVLQSLMNWRRYKEIVATVEWTPMWINQCRSSLQRSGTAKDLQQHLCVNLSILIPWAEMVFMVVYHNWQSHSHDVSWYPWEFSVDWCDAIDANVNIWVWRK